MSEYVFVCKCVKEKAKERVRSRGGDADGDNERGNPAVKKWRLQI